MKKEVGLWIDHRQAVIVTLIGQEQEIKRITSDIETYVRDSRSGDDSREDKRYTQDKGFDDHLSKYYGEVIAYLRNADSILLFGPGVAKSEFQKQLEEQALGERICGIETTDSMTDGQVAAKVRKYFQG